MNATHQALRAATAAAHDRVDSAFAAFDLSDRDGYAAFLRAHAEVLLPLEESLPGERITADWEDRKRGHLLREDLALLRDAGPPTARAHPACADLGPGGEWSDASLAGMLYVIEGSRLGGRFLARKLPAGFPRAYLDSDQPAEKWRNLLDRLETILYEPAQLQSALAAAEQTFAAFERAASRWTKD